REMHAYLRDAVALLPERHRLVIVGYFLEGRTSLELARFLGVTESRVSQLRSEALVMLKEGIEAQYRPAVADPPVGRVARRKATYAADISTASEWKDRLTAVPAGCRRRATSPGDTAHTAASSLLHRSRPDPGVGGAVR